MTRRLTAKLRWVVFVIIFVKGFSCCQVKDFLFEQAQNLTEEDFYHDINVKQSVNRANGLSIYSFLTDEPFLTRNEDDTGKEYVIIPEIEGHPGANFQNKKCIERQWIVLKAEKNPRSIYWVAKVFLRPKAAFDDELSSITLEKQELVLEWSLYSATDAEEVALHCAFSLITPCHFEASSIKPEFIQHQVSQRNDMNFEKFEEIEKDKDFYPLLGDLEPSKQLEGRQVGAAIAGGVLGAAYAVLCNIVGGVLDTLNYATCGNPSAPPPAKLIPKAVSYESLVGENETPLRQYPDYVRTQNDQSNLQYTHNPNYEEAPSYYSDPRYAPESEYYPKPVPYSTSNPQYASPNRMKREESPQLLSKTQRPTNLVLSKNMKLQLKYKGWKTQYVKPKKGIATKETDNIPFYGFGSCPPLASEDYSQTSLTLFYTQVLRTDCLIWIEPIINNLVTSRILIQKDKTFSLNLQHKLISKPKLTLPEASELTGAFQIATFSELFQNQKSIRLKSLDGKELSKSTAFLLKLGENMVETAVTLIPRHEIYLLRHIILYFREFHDKVTDDVSIIELEKCSECQVDLNIMNNDKSALLAFIYYLTRGRGKNKITFEDFFNQNRHLFFREN